MQVTRLGSMALMVVGSLVTGLSGAAVGQPASPDERARATEAQMTDDERFALIISLLGNVAGGAFPPDPRIPAEVKNHSAGYTAGIPRLDFPALQSSDASMGITNPGYRPDDKGATAFPASIVVGSSFNPALAREQGVALAREARIRGFNIVLAGGMNLARDPRNGRNFEYYGEDPWLAALLGVAVGWVAAGGWGIGVGGRRRGLRVAGLALASVGLVATMALGLGSESATTGAYIPAGPANALWLTLVRFSVDRWPGDAPWWWLAPWALLLAWGAVRAALWAKDKKPGLYSMADVLGLE